MLTVDLVDENPYNRGTPKGITREVTNTLLEQAQLDLTAS